MMGLSYALWCVVTVHMVGNVGTFTYLNIYHRNFTHKVKVLLKNWREPRAESKELLLMLTHIIVRTNVGNGGRKEEGDNKWPG
jgi:hypothetical protein